MKTYISYLVIALLMTNALSGQVKIGDRPENLHNASVLELESTSRVLVITRVNDAQMSAINPLRGALVYNTDHDCLHYFNGTEWINICEALDNSFTVSTRADYLSQLFPSAKDSTVVITPTENPDGSLNYNFEVNVISRDNIGASAVTSSKIQNGSIENRHMAPKSISPLKFEDGNNAGDLLRWNGTVWELTNEADISISELDGDPTNEIQNIEEVLSTGNDANGLVLTGLGVPTIASDAATKDYVDTEILASTQTIVSGDPNNSIVASGTDGGAFYDDSALQTDITNNSTNIAANTAQIGINAANIVTNQTNITQNIADIAANSANIATNQSNIAQNTADIADITVVSGDANNSITASGTDGGAFYDDSAIQTDIATNATNIAANQSNIAQNTADIADITVVSGDANNSITASGTDGGAFYDDSAILSDIAQNSADISTNSADIATNQSNIAQNTADIADITVVSGDANNSITASGTDGGAFYDDSAIQTDIATNATNIAANQSNIAQNTADIADITVVSGDANNSITASGTDGGAFYDDSAIQTDIAQNSADIATNATNIAANQSNIAQNTADIADITVVSGDANNSITASGTDGGAFYDDSAIQTATSEIVSGTTGSIFFSDGSGGLLQDNPNFFWDNPDKRLGVGTNTPTSTLQTGGSFATAILRWNGGLLDLDETHHTIIIRADSDINFPPPNTCPGRVYIIKNPAFIVTTDGYTNLTGSSSFDITTQTTITIQSDGQEWQQIN